MLAISSVQLDSHIGRWLSSGLLTLISCYFLLRVGYSTGKAQCRWWSALSFVNLLWAVELTALGRETGPLRFISLAVLIVVTLHRYRVEFPEGRVARFVPKFLSFDDEKQPPVPHRRSGHSGESR